MRREQYERLSAPFRKNPQAVKALNLVNQVITFGVYAVYTVTGLVLLIRRDPRAKRFLLPPAAGFLGVTLFRRVKNSPRPHQVWDIEPLLSRRKDGQSFPSRHTYSIFAIASTFGFLWPVTGALLLIAGIILAAVRVIGGVHFIKDVLAGAACGLLTGLAGRLACRDNK